ncbi:MAG: polyhydroxyalkanoic acid system family protein [Hyphomicrobiales bacterium]|nr:polyhydroxyalkanoic acid system family protein [Hyphomicrobiales bacterium]MBV9520938.1 polyhydroxyalkanoic acid system family protein [Hyphomicrobiales bacterium]
MADPSAPLIVLIPHNLGKAEASRRLRSGIGRLQESFAGKLSVIDEAWNEDHLDFRVTVLGQAANGTIDIAEDKVRLAVQLPQFLMFLAAKARALVERQGRLMLDKK